MWRMWEDGAGSRGKSAHDRAVAWEERYPQGWAWEEVRAVWDRGATWDNRVLRKERERERGGKAVLEERVSRIGGGKGSGANVGADKEQNKNKTEKRLTYID